MWSQQDLEQLYNTIFQRKSVRKFTAEPVTPGLLEELDAACQSLETPLGSARAAFRVLEQKQLKGIISAKSPHYLTLYAEKSEENLIAAAFQLQQLDLWLSSKGLGACWLGMPRGTGEAETADGLPYVITLAFGNPAEPVHRQGTEGFKRKALAEITGLSGAEALLEPVRLAPSATNRQPWYLTGNEGELHLHGKTTGVITKKFLGDMPMMDMGIALCHLWLSAVHEGAFRQFRRVEESAPSPAGYRYAWTVELAAKEQEL